MAKGKPSGLNGNNASLASAPGKAPLLSSSGGLRLAGGGKAAGSYSGGYAGGRDGSNYFSLQAGGGNYSGFGGTAPRGAESYAARLGVTRNPVQGRSSYLERAVAQSGFYGQKEKGGYRGASGPNVEASYGGREAKGYGDNRSRFGKDSLRGRDSNGVILYGARENKRGGLEGETTGGARHGEYGREFGALGDYGLAQAISRIMLKETEIEKISLAPDRDEKNRPKRPCGFCSRALNLDGSCSFCSSSSATPARGYGSRLAA